MYVDNFAQRPRIRFIANVPVRGPRDPIKGEPWTGIGHLGHALVCRIGENGRQQDCLILGWFVVVEMREAVREPGPTVYFCEQVRQLDPWQDIIATFRPVFGGFRHRPRQGSEMKTSVFLRQFTLSTSKPTRVSCS